MDAERRLRSDAGPGSCHQAEEKKSQWLNATRSLGREEAAYMCTLKVDEIERMLQARNISITLTKGASQKWFLLDVLLAWACL